jgi:hypothetical protein
LVWLPESGSGSALKPMRIHKTSVFPAHLSSIREM